LLSSHAAIRFSHTLVDRFQLSFGMTTARGKR
jgi:hypothetical protein